MIESIEGTYEFGTYTKEVGFINDIAFIYDRLPFICYIKDIYYDNDGHITRTCMIGKKEKDRGKNNYKNNTCSKTDPSRKQKGKQQQKKKNGRAYSKCKLCKKSHSLCLKKAGIWVPASIF